MSDLDSDPWQTSDSGHLYCPACATSCDHPGHARAAKYLDPYEIVQIAANDLRARFEVTITGTIHAFEVDSDRGVKVTIEGQEIELHYLYNAARGPMPRSAVKVRRVDS